MRTAVTIDDDLLAKARSFTGLKETSAVIRAALAALVEREAARRLARLGGTEPNLRVVPRRRTEAHPSHQASASNTKVKI